MLSILLTKWITFPPALQPKQWNICLSGETAKEGDFSLWNGHNPKKFLPLLFKVTYCEITSTISLLLLISSISSSLYFTNLETLPFYLLSSQSLITKYIILLISLLSCISILIIILFDKKKINPSLQFDNSIFCQLRDTCQLN